MRFRLWSAWLPGAAPSPVAGAAPDDTGRIRLLVVCDDAPEALPIEAPPDGGVDVVRERTGEAGFYRATTEQFDVVLLSRTLPTRNGLDVLTALRRDGITVPVLFLVVGGTVEERVEALDAGADDCVALPVQAPELHARIRALARRGTADPVRLCAGDVELDPMARSARRAGRRLQLSMREFQLLEYLVRHRGQVVAREHICRDLWHRPPQRALDSVIDVHMARLRKKVDGPGGARLIHTVRGVGYAFGDQPPRSR